MMKPPFAVFATCLIVAAGCHKKAPPAPAAEAATPESAAAPGNPAPDGSGTPAPTAAAPAPTPITPLPPPPKYIAANADNTIRQHIDGEPDAMMTGLLRSFVQKNGRMPQNFYEFSLK